MVDSDCQQCDCDYGGSIKEICEKINGVYSEFYLFYLF